MTREEYIAALKSHDWYFEYAEDQSVWRRGREERKALFSVRAVHDPDWEIWAQYDPSTKEAKND